MIEKSNNTVDVIIGLQWGDEGKGKIVDHLVQKNIYDIVARYQGGCNAGHTIYIDGKKYITHLLPSGLLSGKIGLIGQGVVIDLVTLVNEIMSLQDHIDVWPLLRIASNAHITIPTHRWLDKASEAAKGKDKIGSTQKGIGPTYMDKIGRNGLRFGDLYSSDFKNKYDALKGAHMRILEQFPEVEFAIEKEETLFLTVVDELVSLIAPQHVVSNTWTKEQLKLGKKVLAEGAQGVLLDIDMGTYPYVTSSNTGTAGVQTGLGLSHRDIGKVYGVTKAYVTRVGNGPFPSKLTCAIGKQLQERGGEKGATTGRPRDCGWLDLPLLRYACEINGVDKLIITKLDILDTFDEISVVTTHHVNPINDKSPLSHTVWDGAYDLDDLGLSYESYPGWKVDATNIREMKQLPIPVFNFLNNVYKGMPSIYAVTNGPGREDIILMG